MSDPPPPKKIGSLRDRIAAFEKGGRSAPAPAPAPVPRPKPANVSWKPRATSPPVAEESGSEAPEKKPGAGMSAADAKASIGAGGSLRERMAALQGRGAFGAPAAAPAIPPKPAGDKPKWKPPPRPVVSPPPAEEGEESAAPAEPRLTSPPPQDELRPSGEEETPSASEEKEDSGEPDPEEEERQRRAAIAARMARLGGARVGMAPPIYAKKPEIKKPEVAKAEPPEEHAAEPTVSPAEEPRSLPTAPAEHSSESFASENASATSLLSADSGSSAAPKSPAMPAPAIPRRAAPPRRKAPKSPSPVPPPAAIDIPVVSESPAPDALPTPDQSEESKELQEAVKKSKEDEATLGLPPATLDTPKSAPPHAEVQEVPESSPEVEKAFEPTSEEQEDAAPEIQAFAAEEIDHEEPEVHSPEAPVHEVAPPVHEDEEPVLEAHLQEPNEPLEKATVVVEEPVTIGDEPVAAEPVAAPVSEEPAAAVDGEEDEAERRKRIAERLRQQGGFNPFSGPPPSVRRPSEVLSEQEVELPVRKSSLTSPPTSPRLPPPRSASLRKGSTDSNIIPPPAPERRTSFRQGSMDSVTSPLRSPPLPPTSSRPERRSSVASTKSKEARDIPVQQTQPGDDEHEPEFGVAVRESVNAPIREEPEQTHESRHPEASEWFDEPEEDDREGSSHGHVAQQTLNQASGFDAKVISPRSPPPTERPPPPPPTRTSLPPPPRRQSVPPPPRSAPPPPPPAPAENDEESDYGESQEDYSNAVEEQEPVEEPIHAVSPPARQAPPPPPPAPIAEPEAPVQLAVPPRRQSSDVHPARRSLPPPPPPPQDPQPVSPEDEHPALQPTPNVHPARRSIPPPPPPAPTEEPEAHDRDSERDPISPPYSSEGFEDTYSEEAQTLQIPSGCTSQIHSPVSPTRVPPAIVIPDQGEDELLDEGDVDPIDPSFYSPSKPTFSPSVSEPPSSFHLAPVETPRQVEDPVEEPVDELPAEPEPEPKLEAPKPSVPEDAPTEDEEQARRRTIAERMAKLGGLRFGAPMPPIARRPPPPPTEGEETPAETAEEGQPREPEDANPPAQEESEEDEFARKQRIAARLASMGGMRFGMMPTPMAPPQPPARSPSQQSPEAEEEETPPPPPPRTARRQDSHRERAPSPPSPETVRRESVPQPRSPEHVHQRTSPEVEYENLSVSDGVRVEDSDIEEISPEETEDAPPPVPSRAFRRESAPSPETTRPPVPLGRPPVRAVPVSPAPPPPPVPQVVQGDFVMVEAPEEAPPVPPPRSASLRRPPPRSAPPPPPPPAPVAEEPETPTTSQWGSSVNFGVDTDLSLSGQWSEDSTQYPPTSAAPPPVPAETRPARPVVPEHLSADELMAQWGRIGVQIHEIATTVFEKSKKSVVGDGTSIGFVNAVLHEVPNAVKPVPPYDSFGYLIYEQSGPTVHKRASEIMPGDIIVLQEAKLKGHKGIQIYHQNVGVNEPLFAIIGDFELKKSKVKVFQANQHVGQESVESISYRLEDLKTGLVKIFRVLEA